MPGFHITWYSVNSFEEFYENQSTLSEFMIKNVDLLFYFEYARCRICCDAIGTFALSASLSGKLASTPVIAFEQ